MHQHKRYVPILGHDKTKRIQLKQKTAETRLHVFHILLLLATLSIFPSLTLDLPPSSMLSVQTTPTYPSLSLLMCGKINIRQNNDFLHTCSLWRGVCTRPPPWRRGWQCRGHGHDPQKWGEMIVAQPCPPGAHTWFASPGRRPCREVQWWWHVSWNGVFLIPNTN